MSQIAGQMQAGSGDGVTWLACDGRPLNQQHYGDYLRRVGYTYGRAGMALVRLPYRPGWAVCVRDDPDAPDPPEGPTTTDPPTAVAINPPPATIYGVMAADTRARFPIVGTVSPPGPVTVSLIGAGVLSVPVTVEPNGQFSGEALVDFGTDYTLRVSSDDHPGATMDYGPFDAEPAPIVLAFDPIEPAIPQGSYECFGSVTPADAAVTAALVLWDGSENPEEISVDPGGRWNLKAYFGPTGTGAYLVITPEAQPDRAVESTRFQIVPAIGIDPVPGQSWTPAADVPATLRLGGNFLGLEWEHAEYCLVVDEIAFDFTPLPLQRGPDPGCAFGEMVEVMPATGTMMFRVRKVENPGVSADSNLFSVMVTPGAPVEEAPPEASPTKRRVRRLPARDAE